MLLGLAKNNIYMNIKHKIQKLLITLTLLFLPFVTLFADVARTIQLTNKTNDDYVIGGRDVLYITVHDEPDLSYDNSNNRSLRVSVDGKISFPFLGDVDVSNLTSYQLEEKIESMLKQGYIVNPHVSVNVREYHSKKIFVLGAISKPGAYHLVDTKNILGIISELGGIMEGSAGNEVIVIRSKNGINNNNFTVNKNDQHRFNFTNNEVTEYIRLDLERLLKKGDLSLNIELIDKDVLYVPFAESVYVFGEVSNPGALELVRKDITVTEAISMSGGFTDLSAQNRVHVVRVVNGKTQKLFINVDKIINGKNVKDIKLEPGDIVVVPEVLF